MLLKDKVAVITGSGRGLGRSMALAMAKEGAKVVINDVGGSLDGAGSSVSPAVGVVTEIKQAGGEAVANSDSVATPEGGESIIKCAVDNFGRVDILVNNAGILRDRMLWNMSEEEWDAVLKVHLYGTFHCSRAVSGLMRQQKSGRILCMTSLAGLQGSPGQPNYSAAKAGICGFVRSSALALGRYGVTVNAIAPAAGTRMTSNVPDERMREWALKEGWATEDEIAKLSPAELLQKALGSPDDVAPIAVYLASDRAANINGQIIAASGGQIGLYCRLTEVKTIFKQGRWTQDELAVIIPKTLADNLKNPALSE